MLSDYTSYSFLLQLILEAILTGRGWNELVTLGLGIFVNFEFFFTNLIFYFMRKIKSNIFNKFIHEIKHEINLRVKIKDDLNFYEIGSRCKWVT